MSESNDVKFIEDNGKWMWKRYDADGSVTYRSPLFDTEQAAHDDYDANNGAQASNSNQESIPDTGTAAPEGDANVGSATGEQSASI